METRARETKNLAGLGFLTATVLLFGVWLWFLNVGQAIVPLGGGVPGFMHVQLSLRSALLANPIGILLVLLTLGVFAFAYVRVMKSGKHHNVFAVFCTVTDAVLVVLILLAVTGPYFAVLSLLANMR